METRPSSIRMSVNAIMAVSGRYAVSRDLMELLARKDVKTRVLIAFFFGKEIRK